MIKYVSNSDMTINENEIKISKPKIISITGVIDEITSTNFLSAITELKERKQNIIPVIINSYGGSVYELLAIVEIMRSSTVPIMTIANGKAFSAAAFLLSCGTPGYRYATETSSIMIHDASSFAHGKIQEIKNETRHINSINETIFEILDKNCNQKKGFFKKKMKEFKHLDYYISADKSKKLGLIDHVGLPKLEYDVKCGFKI